MKCHNIFFVHVKVMEKKEYPSCICQVCHFFFLNNRKKDVFVYNKKKKKKFSYDELYNHCSYAKEQHKQKIHT